MAVEVGRVQAYNEGMGNNEFKLPPSYFPTIRMHETREDWDAQPQNWPFCQKCMSGHPKDRPCIADLERAVIEAAVAYFVSQREWTENGVAGDFAKLYDTLWGTVDALLREREGKG